MQKIHDKYYIKTANEIRIQYYISQPFLTHLTKLSFTDFFSEYFLQIFLSITEFLCLLKFHSNSMYLSFLSLAQIRFLLILQGDG